MATLSKLELEFIEFILHNVQEDTLSRATDVVSGVDLEQLKDKIATIIES